MTKHINRNLDFILYLMHYLANAIKLGIIVDGILYF